MDRRSLSVFGYEFGGLGKAREIKIRIKYRLNKVREGSNWESFFNFFVESLSFEPTAFLTTL